MSVFKRYFRFTSGPLVARIDALHAARDAAAVRAAAVSQIVGGEFKIWDSNGQFAGFAFQLPPDPDAFRLVKKHRLYMPRKNTELGRKVWAHVQKVGELPAPVDSVLADVGLDARLPQLFHTGCAYTSGLWGFGAPTNVWFVSVPWRDVDPAELEKYRAQRDTEGAWFDRNLEFLLWTPPAEWEEVKGWQVTKESEEINARLKGPTV